jgi:dTDP-L-rhamnose 4-epimerase
VSILITGSHGFIGTHVRKQLQGHNLICVDSWEPRVHKEPPPSWAEHYGNIPISMFLEEQPEVLIHLAAQVGVVDSMDDPLRYVQQNTVETVQLLQTLKALHPSRRPKRLVVASSMSVYGDPQTQRSIGEHYRVFPASVYGQTKYDQERLCRIYGPKLGMDVIALRFFNVYGPGQALHNPYTGVLANFSQALLNGLAPTVYEDGQQTRDFVYVEDVANVVTVAALGGLRSSTYNVCTGRATTIESVARQLATTLELDIQPDITYKYRVGDIRHCIGNSKKLRKQLGSWRPRSLQEGLTLYAKDLLCQ